jgi:CBS domain-containing protein
LKLSDTTAKEEIMARYGGDFTRQRMGMHDFAERGSGYDEQYGYGGRGDYRRFGGRGGAGGGAGRIGGMRSDAGGTRWDRFPGEEGWYGAGYAGYPGGDVRGGARGYGGEYRRGGGRAFGGSFGTESRGGVGGGAGGGFDIERSQRARQSDADRVRARDVMTDDPECVTPDATVAEVAKKMRELNVGVIPVVDDLGNRRLRGVITDRDLAVRVLASGKDGKAKIGEYMTEQVEVVNQNDTVHDVLNVMKREQVRRVPVTDRDGRLVGIIAQADLSVSYAGLDLQRETEVEEAIERISEPARPRR